MDVCFKLEDQNEDQEYPSYEVLLEPEKKIMIGLVYYWDFVGEYYFDAVMEISGHNEFSYDSEMLREISEFMDRLNNKLSQSAKQRMG